MNSEPASDAFLQLDVVGFVRATYPRQEIDVSVNSIAIGELTKPTNFVESSPDDLRRKPNRPNNQ